MSFEPETQIRLLLDFARMGQKYDQPGTYFRITAASSVNAVVALNFNSLDTRNRNYRRGGGFKGKPFAQFYITHDAQPGEWVEITTFGNHKNLLTLGDYDAFAETTSDEVNIASHSLIDATAFPVREINPIHTMRPVGFALLAGEKEISISNAQNSGTPVVLIEGIGGAAYTVPAGKELLITSCRLAQQSTAQAAELEVYDTAGASVVGRLTSYGAAAFEAWEGKVIPAAHQLRIKATSSYASASITGIERNV